MFTVKTGPTEVSEGPGWALRPLTYEVDLPVIVDMVEGDADSGRLSMEDSKLAAVGLPGKRYDAFWKRGKGAAHHAEVLHSTSVTRLLSSPFISNTSTGTCFSLIRKISKLVTTPCKGSETT